MLIILYYLIYKFQNQNRSQIVIKELTNRTKNNKNLTELGTVYQTPMEKLVHYIFFS